MYRCNSCGATFTEPDSEQVCWEDYNGVSSLFGDRHYGEIAVCPECGSDSIEDYYDPEEWDEDCEE